MSSPLAYRRDIDGLRALAVLPVLLYHAGVPGVSGGFVGVDVFFVISGYLITGIVAREMDEQRFSLVRFYERRARRILPALFAMIAAVLAAASWLYLPGDFEAVPRSALMALGFLANVWFFARTGYFAGGAETMPLLHTWSLGVEEQFYIGFPLLLWLVARWLPGWRLLVVAAAALISFTIAILTQDAGDSFAFYLLPARAWELFAGSLLALGAMPPVRTRVWREGLALAGLVGIVLPVALYDSSIVFPGLAAIPPVLGAALLVHCAPGTLSGRLLSWRPMVGIGLISYSLYLWHWPLIVFVEYAQDAPLAPVQTMAVIALSLLIAWASWAFIEAPFRSRERFGQVRVFAWSGGGMAALCAAALAMVALGGWPARFPPDTLRFAAAKTDYSPQREHCLAGALDPLTEGCVLGAAVPPDAVLWGDSHGVELAWALGESLRPQGRAIRQRTFGSCPPVLGFAEAVNPGCPRFNQAVIAEIEDDPAIREVYLAAFWAGSRYRTPQMIAQIDATLARLQGAGKQVILIGPVPAQPFNVPRTLARAAAQGDTGHLAATPLAEHRRATRWLSDQYPRWRAAGVRVLDPALVLADGADTLIVADGRPLYFDSHHLSLAGARRVVAGL